MKTILTAVAMTAAMATSAMAFTADSTNAELLAELDAATHLVEVRNNERLRGSEGWSDHNQVVSHREYQDLKSDFKRTYYGIRGNEKIIVDGERARIRELPAMIETAIEALNAPTTSAVGAPLTPTFVTAGQLTGLFGFQVDGGDFGAARNAGVDLDDYQAVTDWIFVNGRNA